MAARAKARRQKQFHKEHCLRPRFVATEESLAEGIGICRTREQLESRHPDICRKCYEPRDDHPGSIASRWLFFRTCLSWPANGRPACHCEHHKTEVWMA